MSYETILFSVEKGIARLTLNRPEKLNSFNVLMHTEVRQALERVKLTKPSAPPPVVVPRRKKEEPPAPESQPAEAAPAPAEEAAPPATGE